MNSEGPSWLGKLFSDYGQPLVRFLQSRTNDRGEAEDIAQEAWVRLQRLKSADAVENPRAFLFQTATNLMIDRRRREQVELRYRTEVQPLHDENGASLERQAEIVQTLTHVMRAIDELPQNCRQAFVLHRGRGMSYPDIANILGVSVSMVEKYVIQALKHCRQRLVDESDLPKRTKGS